MPKWYTDRPVVGPHDAFWMTAFSELSTERDYGMGFGPIPWSKVVEYGRHHGLSTAMINVLVAVIRELDEAWIKHQQDAKRKAERRNAPKKPKKTTSKR